MALRRFVFAFGTVFALCYAIAVGSQLALFTVFPSLGIILPGTVQSRDVADPALSFLAPAMYWYGWTATATLGALAAGAISLAVSHRGIDYLKATATLGDLTAGVISLAVPEAWTRWVWPGWLWVIPVAAMAACVDFTLPWFRL